MRPLLLIVAILGLGACTDNTLGQDTAYRRLVDGFDSYDHCITAGQFTDCFDTLTLCASGLVRMNLAVDHQDGNYLVEDQVVTAKFLAKTVIFNLETASSRQLPGAHVWEVVEPVTYDCSP